MCVNNLPRVALDSGGLGFKVEKTKIIISILLIDVMCM